MDIRNFKIDLNMKYMGSKMRISKCILPIITNNLSKGMYYVEPFCGGCNIISEVKHDRRIASDANNYLIAMWRFLCAGYEFPKIISKELYSEYRCQFNKRGFIGLGDTLEEAMIGWIGFMGSFNGRFYDGGYSGHNVKGRDYISEQIRNTLSQIDKLKGVEFWCGKYDELELPYNSVIYCDPPYKDTKQYLISKQFNSVEFWMWCRRMTNKGHKVIISEYQAPDDFTCIWEKSITNSLNIKNTYNPIEKLFVYKGLL